MFYHLSCVEMCWGNLWHPCQCSVLFKCDSSIQEPQVYHNHECVVCVCNMDMQFIYVHAGWENSANDLQVLDEMISNLKHGFLWPPTSTIISMNLSIICTCYDYCYKYHNIYYCSYVRSYYLVDLGFPIGTSFFPPHKSTRYHVQEFCLSNRQPTTNKKLYNYRHSSLRMVIERSFGVLKARFPILNLIPKFKRGRQRYMIVACCTLHNFIRINNRGDKLFHTWAPLGVEGTSTRSQPCGNIGASSSTATQRHVLEMSNAAKRLMTQFRDDIIDLMWVDYVAHRH